MIYLDNSATTRVLPEAAEAAMKAMTEQYFNPSGAYAPAVSTERSVEAARQRAAEAMGRAQNEILFTSGGTESNNMAIFGILDAVRGKKRVITCQNEHPSVFETVRSLEKRGDTETVFIGCNEDGTASLAELERALQAGGATLVSLMHVNNETDAINDLAAAYALIRRLAPNALFHVDGVQAFCKTPFLRVPCDLYSVSAHKFHAPKGVGMLFVRNGVRFSGGQIGGGQERGLRSGTTNVPAILGMDAALSLYRAHQSEWLAQMRACKERLWQNLSAAQDILLNGPSIENGAGHILNVSFLGVRGEVLLNALSEAGVCVSTGSACSARKAGKNRVLTAINVVGARQEGAIRFSFCPFNTLDEMDEAADKALAAVAFLRRYKRR